MHGNAGGGELGGGHVERQVAVAAVAAETPLAGPLAALVVVVHERDPLVAVPPVPAALRLVQDPVAEYGEVVDRVGLAGDHPLEPAGYVFDAQGGVEAGPFDDVPSDLPPPRYLP